MPEFDYETIRNAFATNDALGDNGEPFEDLLADLGTAPEDLMRIAEQRAWRVACIATGDKAKLDFLQQMGPRPQKVNLTEKQEAIFLAVAPAYMDALTAGLRLRKYGEEPIVQCAVCETPVVKVRLADGTWRCGANGECATEGR